MFTVTLACAAAAAFPGMNSPTCGPLGLSSPVNRPIVSKHASLVRIPARAAAKFRFRRAVIVSASASAISFSTRAGSFAVVRFCCTWCDVTFAMIAGTCAKCRCNDHGDVPANCEAITRSELPCTCCSSMAARSGRAQMLHVLAICLPEEIGQRVLPIVCGRKGQRELRLGIAASFFWRYSPSETRRPIPRPITA
jgi:hypothetical protein